MLSPSQDLLWQDAGNIRRCISTQPGTFAEQGVRGVEPAAAAHNDQGMKFLTATNGRGVPMGAHTERNRRLLGE